MTNNTIIRQFHYGGGGGEGDNVWQWFRNSTREAYNAIDQIVSRYRAMINERIAPAERAMLLEAMLREAKMKGDEADTVRAWAIEEPPQNTYEILNLITRASSHVIEEPMRVRRAQLTAASYTHEEEHSRLCPVCHARRN